MVRGICAVAVGVLTAAIFFSASAALLIVATVGVPLGAGSRAVTLDTFGDLVGYLTVGVVAAVVGGWVTARIAGPRTAWPRLLLAVVLSVSAYSGFAKPTSQWPHWWTLTLTALAPAGAWVGGRGIQSSPARNRARRRNQPRA